MTFLLLAQTLISQETVFTVPILLILLGLAGALAEARWRVGQVERHADKQDERVQRLEARLSSVELQQASHGVVLGEVKALLTEVRDELRGKSRVA
jgi:hypothetical protein